MVPSSMSPSFCREGSCPPLLLRLGEVQTLIPESPSRHPEEEVPLVPPMEVRLPLAEAEPVMRHPRAATHLVPMSIVQEPDHLLIHLATRPQIMETGTDTEVDLGIPICPDHGPGRLRHGAEAEVVEMEIMTKSLETVAAVTTVLRIAAVPEALTVGSAAIDKSSALCRH